VFEEVVYPSSPKRGGEPRKVLLVQIPPHPRPGNKPDLALVYDLTVPLARYVAEHEHDGPSVPALPIQRVVSWQRAQTGPLPEVYHRRH